MDQQRRQSMQELIESAAKLQNEDLAWINNLYKKRLKDLQETEELRQAWLKKENESEWKSVQR